MMPGTDLGKKLDLSKLTDEEAKHVWKVVQRDFDLRKKEEDRLGDLKTQIEKEDTKRELLGKQTSVTDSLCIRCLQPFKFLVNSKHQCLDCQLYTCKSCSRYNKKERGWVCDPCRMARVLKIGTLEWYHENVRARFKRFGSAKVMRSLFKRLSGEHSYSQNDLRDPSEYDTQSIAGVHDGYEEHNIEDIDGHYRRMKKTKRLLTVHPIDLDLDRDYSVDSRRQSCQAPNSHDIMEESVRAESVPSSSEADMASVFRRVLEERQGDREPEFNADVQLNFSRRISLGSASRHDDILYPDSRVTARRSLSRLSHSSCGSGSAGGPRYSSYMPGLDDSEEEDECHRYPLYQSHHRLRSHASQESLNSLAPPPQITELNRRMSAIETLLNRLEQKVTPPFEQAHLVHQAHQAHQAPQTPASSSPLPQWEEVDLEEQQLRQKLDEMTGNISDHGLTSDEDESNRPRSPRETPGGRSPEREADPSKPPSRPSSRPTSVVENLNRQTESQKASSPTHSLERKLSPLEEGSRASFRGSTAILFELEDKVAQAAASVQSTQSEVSYIENRIAALSAAGMSVDKGRRKSAIPISPRRLSHDFPTSKVDKFVRNSFYRGSLTQRTPVVKPKTRATCAKPVMAQGP